VDTISRMKPTLAICLALALGACASANTPAQDLAYARWAQCSAPYTQPERVLLDGRIIFLTSNSSDTQAVLQCLYAAGQAGPRLPDPVPVRPTGGP
jgi:hypothetical protein